MRAALTVVFVLACFTSSHAQEQTGTIVFYREPHSATSHFKPELYCDSRELARIENGTHFEVSAPLGLHTCTVESSKRPLVEINVLAGQAAYVHVEIQPGFREHVELFGTTEDEYDKQKSRLKSVKEWTRNDLTTTQPQEKSSSAESPSQPLSPTLAEQPSKIPDSKHSGKFGDLAVTVTEFVIFPSQTDRTELKAFVRVANKGEGVICASLGTTLNTTFGLQYRGGSDQSPRMQEMLPGESTVGDYVFDIKDGVYPIELVFRLGDLEHGIRCGPAVPMHDGIIPDEIRVDVRDLPVTAPLPNAK
jgi:hypothetical protein